MRHPIAGVVGVAQPMGGEFGVLVTVLSRAPIRGVLRQCSGRTGFAGVLDSAIEDRPGEPLVEWSGFPGSEHRIVDVIGHL